MELENPFEDYNRPNEWLKAIKREQSKKARERRLGRPLGTWGGKRSGAGRKPQIGPKPTHNYEAKLNLNNIQRESLAELGNGDIDKGIQSFIDKHF